MKSTIPNVPHAHSTLYKAGAAIFTFGPMPREDLFTAVDFGCIEKRSRKIKLGLDGGWLTEADGKVGLTALAKAHFSGEELPEVSAKAPTGSVATSRASNVYERPALSKRFIPNSKGTRADVPTFSVRQTPSFCSVPTGGA